MGAGVITLTGCTRTGVIVFGGRPRRLAIVGAEPAGAELGCITIGCTGVPRPLPRPGGLPRRLPPACPPRTPEKFVVIEELSASYKTA